VQSARARGFTPDAVPTRRKEKEWKQQANASKPKSIRKRSWGKLQDYSTANPDTAELETTNKLISGARRGVLGYESDGVISTSYVKRHSSQSTRLRWYFLRELTSAETFLKYFATRMDLFL